MKAFMNYLSNNKPRAENEGWVPGAVTCWISEFDIEETEQKLNPRTATER